MLIEAKLTLFLWHWIIIVDDEDDTPLPLAVKTFSPLLKIEPDSLLAMQMIPPPLP
jgi:hypothetical protein